MDVSDDGALSLLRCIISLLPLHHKDPTASGNDLETSSYALEQTQFFVQTDGVVQMIVENIAILICSESDA